MPNYIKQHIAAIVFLSGTFICQAQSRHAAGTYTNGAAISEGERPV